MKSKMEMFLNNLQVNDLVCPLCRSKFDIFGKSLQCRNQHNFDINKKGYVKLHQINKKHTDRIYTKDLFLARRYVINQGFYNNLHKKIIEIIESKDKSDVTLLDIGCGEASHSALIAKCLKNYKSFYVIDLNTDAIELSTDYLNYVKPIVCDVYNLPFSKIADIILDVLSPFNYQQIYETLKDDGVFIKVVPTKNYLKELRKINNLSEYTNEEEVLNNLQKHFKITGTFLVEDVYKITEKDAKAFAAMTPLMNNIKSIKLPKEITISLKIYTGVKR